MGCPADGSADAGLLPDEHRKEPKAYYSKDCKKTIEQDIVGNQNRNTLSDQPPKTFSHGVERKKHRKG